MSKLSIKHFLTDKQKHGPLGWAVPLLDRILAINTLNRVYENNGFTGLESKAFTANFMSVFDLTLEHDTVSLDNIPKTGPLIVVANHPFGGMEGVALADLLTDVRPDVKLMANRALSIFPELDPIFIHTNPISTNAAGNMNSIKQCLKHLKSDGLLVLFPAGRVSYSQTKNDPITDHKWNRMVASLARKAQCSVVPIHIGGQNRPLFYRMGHLYFRLKLLMLIREMLAGRGRTIPLEIGKPAVVIKAIVNDQKMTDIYRLLTYLMQSEYRQQWPPDQPNVMLPISKAFDGKVLAAELEKLPENQLLLRHRNYAVYYLMCVQAPSIIDEIRRQREETFRDEDEGSGQPQDGDDFDDSYTHLIVFDRNDNSIVGAYRMGRTDILQASGGNQALYLSCMFNFAKPFGNQQGPCLELGRSYIVKKHQRSFHALMLLFKGICSFVYQHPEYKTLYGTVSLSRQYDPLSILLIQKFLVSPTEGITPKQGFTHVMPHELSAYIEKYGVDYDTLDWLIQQIEPDGKGLPILVKQYAQMGATFHSVAIDPNFSNTPGLLLSVDVPSVPERFLKLYLGDNYESYLAKITSDTASTAEQGEPS